MTRPLRRRLLVTLLLLSGFVARSLGQTAAADEYDIRAAMLYNLTRFVEWPAGKLDAAHPRIAVCIAGSDPIRLSFDHLLEQEHGAARPVTVRHLDSLDGAQACDVLYAGHGEQKNLKQSAAALTRAGVLVVSELPNAGHPEQTIGLPTVEEHVHIEVNLGAAERAGLTISSKLLRLATVSR